MEKITAITNAKFDKILYNVNVTCWHGEIAVMFVRRKRRRIRCVNIRLDRNRF